MHSFRSLTKRSKVTEFQIKKDLLAFQGVLFYLRQSHLHFIMRAVCMVVPYPHELSKVYLSLDDPLTCSAHQPLTLYPLNSRPCLLFFPLNVFLDFRQELHRVGL